MHPILCNPTHYCCAEHTDGPTLVIAGLIPGTYYVEEIGNCTNCGCWNECEYDTTITGPICGNAVNVTDSNAPTVITIVSRRRLRGNRRRCRCYA